MKLSTFLFYQRVQKADHIAWIDNGSVRGYFGGRRSVGKPKGKWKKIVCMDNIHLLQIRTLKAAARKEKIWK